MISYETLGKQFIGGKWRQGQSSRLLKNINPYNDEVLTEITAATVDDIDEAYASALESKREWDKVNAYKKRDILEKAVDYIKEHEEEITEIIVEELGGTRLKAAFEISLVKNMIKEAATFPLRMEGKILPSTEDSKENRLYRIPAGVVGVISHLISLFSYP